MIVWQMLLPFDIVDVICVADVIAKVADGIAYHDGCGLCACVSPKDTLMYSYEWTEICIPLIIPLVLFKYLSLACGRVA